MDLQAYNEPKRYAQFDGIEGVISELVRRITPPTTFLEIGAGDGSENNTRFLLELGWRGAWCEADPELAERASEINYRTHALFVTASSWHQLPVKRRDPVGVLSIDIDGNDYWVWKAMLEWGYRPCIVVIECQLWSGDDYIMPYDPGYVFSHRIGDHTPGAGKGALAELGAAHGYHYVGKLDNPHDPNLFFVREEYRDAIRAD